MSPSVENWYCEQIAGGPWPFVLLLLPLAGAYVYGQSKHKLAWILIGVWLVIQIPISFVTNLLVNCSGASMQDLPPMTEEPPPQTK